MPHGIIEEVVTMHAEEATFLWLLRDGAAGGSHYSLADLAHLDGRVETHVDGLRIAGEVGWEICKEALSWADPGEIFTAAMMAFESWREEKIHTVLAADSKGAWGQVLHCHTTILTLEIERNTL